MLRDSARIQQEDATYLKRKFGKGRAGPLYTEDEARRTAWLFEPLDSDKWHELEPDFRLRFREAGHIPGSAIVEIELQDGVLWRRQMPLLPSPDTVDGCDVLISESTYGSGVHPPTTDLRDALRSVIQLAADNDGRVIIPAFSLGRTQLIVFLLKQMRNEGLIGGLPVFVDSPLATRLTDVCSDHWFINDDDDDPLRRALGDDRDTFDFEGLSYVQSQQESIALNRRSGPLIVISASGMCENGRVVHHIRHAIGCERNTILIIGYQARNTLGRRLLQQRDKVSVFGREYPVRARVARINGLSAHADAEDLKWWFEQLASRGGSRTTFLVHGEPDTATALSGLVRDCCDQDPVVPRMYESFEI